MRLMCIDGPLARGHRPVRHDFVIMAPMFRPFFVGSATLYTHLPKAPTRTPIDSSLPPVPAGC
ncbi:MAG: hypothetical protein ABS36_07030 [Acidobacteria bacterium SCN 69-37]|nr:MAG: hypothetical protein ABS36_07030 [Acidobacteria bacterium SCN 69-37]